MFSQSRGAWFPSLSSYASALSGSLFPPTSTLIGRLFVRHSKSVCGSSVECLAMQTVFPAAMGSICTMWRTEPQKAQFTPSQDVSQDLSSLRKFTSSNCLTTTLYKCLSHINIDDTTLVFSAFNNWKF